MVTGPWYFPFVDYIGICFLVAMKSCVQTPEHNLRTLWGWKVTIRSRSALYLSSLEISTTCGIAHLLRCFKRCLHGGRTVQQLVTAALVDRQQDGWVRSGSVLCQPCRRIGDRHQPRHLSARGSSVFCLIITASKEFGWTGPRRDKDVTTTAWFVPRYESVVAFVSTLTN